MSVNTSDTEQPDYDTLTDALFETLAALADLQARLDGGAVRSGTPPEQVIEEVWRAYDIEECTDILEASGYDRERSTSPVDWAVDERVPSTSQVQTHGQDD